MKQIHKEYGLPFSLEPTKLTRLLEKIHERLGEHKTGPIRDHFEVFLSGNRREEMTSVEDVVALENSRKRRIERLLLTCSTATLGAARSDHEVQVDFAAPKSSQTGSSRVIAVSVRSEDAGWASRALAEIEEQVERTRVSYAQPVGILVILLILGVGFFIAQFGIRVTQDLQSTGWLRDADLDRVAEILSQNRTMTEPELREITTTQFRNILQAQRPSATPQKDRNRRVVGAAAALFIVIACGVYLVQFCYPRAVFFWGDEVDRLAGIETTRRVLWTVILGVLVTGVLSRMFWPGTLPPPSV